MKRAILLLIAVLFAFGVAIKASASARLDGMGANIYQVEDIDSIFLYANKVLDYKNTVDFRLNWDNYYDGSSWGGGYYEAGGIIHDLGNEFGTLAIYVNRPTSSSTGSLAYAGLLEYDFPSIVGGSTYTGGWLLDWYGGNYFQPTNNNLDLIWANKLEGFGDLGVHLNYADYSPGNWFSSPYLDSQEIGLSVGLGIGEFIGFKETNIHFGFDENAITDSQAATPVKDLGIYSITFGALGITDLDSSNTWHLALDGRFDQSALPGNFDPAGNGMSANDLIVMISSSMTHKISGKGFVNCGLQLEYMGGRDWYNDNVNAYNVVWSGSVESALNNWLTARAGIRKPIWSRAYWAYGSGITYGAWGDPSVDYSSSYQYNDYVQFSIGASVNVENWTLDLNIDPSSFENMIENPAPGAGIFYGTTDGSGLGNNGGALHVTSADLRYKF